MTLSYPLCKKMETQKQNLSQYPIMTLPPGAPTITKTAWHLPPSIPPTKKIYTTPPIHPRQDTPCHSNTPSSRTKPPWQDHKLHSWQWQQLGQVLHKHCSFYHKSHKDTAVITTQSIKTQDRQDERPSCPRTVTPSKPQSFRPLPHPTWWHLEDVQNGWSVLLDCQGDRPLCWYHRLEQTLANGTALHIPRPCFFRGIWWHCQWKSQQQLCHRGHAAWSLMLLLLSDCRGEHP